MTITQALALIAERDPFLKHAADKAAKAAAVNSPIRVKRITAVADDALNAGQGTYTADERVAINRAVAEYVRANTDSL